MYCSNKASQYRSFQNRIILFFVLIFILPNTLFAKEVPTFHSLVLSITKDFEYGDYKKGLARCAELSTQVGSLNDAERTELIFLKAYGEVLGGDFASYKKHKAEGETLFYKLNDCASTTLYSTILKANIEYGDYQSADKIYAHYKSSCKQNDLSDEVDFFYIKVLYKKGFHIVAQKQLISLIYQTEENLAACLKIPVTKINKKTLPQEIISIKRRLAELKNLQAGIFLDNGNYFSADSLIKSQELWIKNQIGSGERVLADIYFIHGKYAETQNDEVVARNYYEKAYDLLIKAKYGKCKLTARTAIDYYVPLITLFRSTGHIKEYKKTKDALETRIRMYYGQNNYYYSKILQLNIEKEKQQEDWEKAIRLTKEMLASSLIPEDHPDRILYLQQLNEIGVIVYDLKLAQASLEQAVELEKSKSGNDAPKYHLLRLKLASYYIDYTGALKEAEAIFDYSLDSVVSKQIYHRHRYFLMCMFQKSKLYELTDRFDLANATLKGTESDILKYYNTSVNYYAILLYRRARINLLQGDLNQAELNVTNALNTFESLKDKTDQEWGYAFETKAWIQTFLGNYGIAEESLKKSVRYTRTSTITTDVYLKAYSTIYINSGRYREAEKMLSENLANKTIQFGADHRQLLVALNYLAMLHIQMGDYAKAEKDIVRAQKIALTTFGEKSSINAEILNRKIDYNIALSDYSMAKTNAGKLINILTSIYSKDHLLLALAYQKQARIEQYLNSDLNQIALIYQQSLAILIKNVGNKNPLVADLYKDLSLLYLQGNNFSDASKQLELAKQIWVSNYGLENVYDANYNYIAGLISYKQQDYKLAQTYFSKATSIYGSIYNTQHPDYISALCKTGQMAYILKDYPAAVKTYNTAIGLYSQFITKQFPSLSERQQTNVWNTIHADYEFYYAMTYHLNDAYPELVLNMFNMTLSTKALLLNSSMKVRKNIFASKDTLLISQYQNWLDKKELLTRSLSMSSGEQTKSGISVDDLAKEVEALEKTLSESSTAFASESASKQVDWKQLKAVLAPGEAVVEMVRFRDFGTNFSDTIIYAALILNSEENSLPKFVSMNNGALLESKYFKYHRNALRLKIKDMYSYNMYWKKIEEALPSKLTRLYFSSDGIYNQMNLEAIERTDGKFVIDVFPLTLISTSRDLLNRKFTAVQSNKKGKAIANQNAVPQEYVLIGNPTCYTDANGSEFVALPGAEAEVKSISTILQTKQNTVEMYIGDKATESLVKDLKSPYVFHIATHGYFLEDENTGEDNFSDESQELIQNPLYRSGLLLTHGGTLMQEEQNIYNINKQDGVLTAYEAMNLDFDHTELVVLSACETGLGDIQMGEGVYGLQRAFIVAGAKTIIMSLFKVNDEITRELMDTFYKYWLESGNKRDAFTKAKLEMKNKYPEVISWSSFIMVGVE